MQTLQKQSKHKTEEKKNFSKTDLSLKNVY